MQAQSLRYTGMLLGHTAANKQQCMHATHTQALNTHTHTHTHTHTNHTCKHTHTHIHTHTWCIHVHTCRHTLSLPPPLSLSLLTTETHPLTHAHSSTTDFSPGRAQSSGEWRPGRCSWGWRGRRSVLPSVATMHADWRMGTGLTAGSPRPTRSAHSRWTCRWGPLSSFLRWRSVKSSQLFRQ